MHFNGQKFSGVLEQLYFTPSFGVKNAKIHFFDVQENLCKTATQKKTKLECAVDGANPYA